MQQTYVEPFLVPGQGVDTARPAKRTRSPSLTSWELTAWAERRQTVNSEQKSLRTFVTGALEELWGSGELARGAFPEKVCFHE